MTARMTDEELGRHAFQVLARELGLAGYARFLRLFGSGRGDYTAERQKWQAGLTVDDVSSASCLSIRTPTRGEAGTSQSVFRVAPLLQLTQYNIDISCLLSVAGAGWERLFCPSD